MEVQHFEQLDQCQRRLGLAVLVAGECIDAAAKDFGCLARSSVKAQVGHRIVLAVAGPGVFKEL